MSHFMSLSTFPTEVSIANADPILSSQRAVMPKPLSGVTVLVPAYNEAGSIADTIASLRNQTIPPTEIIVIDDCSTDATAEVATASGATVIRPAVNTGSKAGAQNYALRDVKTPFTMAIAPETPGARDPIE